MVFSRNFLALAVLTAFSFTACDTDDGDGGGLFDPDKGQNDGGNPDVPYGTGLLQGGTPSTTPVQANFAFGSSQLAPSVDLTMHFPPIGDQGSYGTCVAWAVGYNFKTAINAIDAGEQGSALADPAKQGSARYLFTAVPDGEKGSDCNGMLFDPAFKVLQQKGLASLSEVPYSNLGNCAANLVETSWDNFAADNKVANYRRVDGSLEAIKRTLSDRMPIVFGAKLGSAFIQWTGDGVLDTEGTFDPNYQHSYHAMVIAGYDDTKGARGAFRVINSWTTNWGDRGSVWIDYDFFMREMLMKGDDGSSHLYIATNGQGGSPDDNKNDNPPAATGAELTMWVFDESINSQGSSPLDRSVTYDVYNFGSQVASASSDWDIYYVYYNAFDANDWGVLFQNQITDDVSELTCDATGCVLNADIAVESSLGVTLFGSETIVQGYTMPNISGQYFLMMVADAEEEIAEYDEFDNYYFPSLEPITINGGNLGLAGSGKDKGAFRQNPDRGVAITAAQLRDGDFEVASPEGNAYTVREMADVLNAARESGEFALRARLAQTAAPVSGGR